MIRAGKLLSTSGERAAKVDLSSAIGRMLASFSVRGDAVVLTDTYVAALSDLDVDDAIKALDRFSRNVVPGHNNAFEPNPVQVRAEVDRVNNMFRSPGRPDPVPALPAPKIEPRTAEQKAKVDELVAGFRKAVGSGDAAVAALPRSPMHPWLREYHENRREKQA